MDTSGECLCGCGEPVGPEQKFRPGHDQKLRARPGEGGRRPGCLEEVGRRVVWAGRRSVGSRARRSSAGTANGDVFCSPHRLFAARRLAA